MTQPAPLWTRPDDPSAPLPGRSVGPQVALDGATLHVRIGSQVASVRMPAVVQVAVAGDDVTVADASGRVVARRGGAWIDVDGKASGRDVVLVPGTWGYDRPDRPLPEGGTHTARVAAFLTGDGEAWIDAGYVYVRFGAERPRAVGTAGAKAALLVGPEGALLLAIDGAAWTHVGGPGRSLVPLATPLARADGEIAWDINACTVQGGPEDERVTLRWSDGRAVD
jgi:hypothetical protein